MSSSYRPPVALGLLVAGDRYLLGKRRPDRRLQPGVWELPGGHVEAGESPSDALKRELKEELDVTARIFDLRWKVTEDVVLHVFVVSEWDSALVENPLSEHSQLGWFELNDPPPAPSGRAISWLYKGGRLRSIARN